MMDLHEVGCPAPCDGCGHHPADCQCPEADDPGCTIEVGWLTGAAICVRCGPHCLCVVCRIDADAHLAPGTDLE